MTASSWRFRAERTEAFCEGHNHAFAHFGGVPRNIVYDNTKIAVAEILGDGKRKRTQAFTELQSTLPVRGAIRSSGKGQ